MKTQRRKISFVALALLVFGFLGGVDAEADSMDIAASSDGGLISPTFIMEHVEGSHEKYVPGEDSGFPPIPGDHMEVSARPYPYNIDVATDSINKDSTLPVDLDVIVKGEDNQEVALWFNNINGYSHRNLTIQEIDPNNPDDPNNANPVVDIRSLPVEYGYLKYETSGTFQNNVKRMFRVGVYRKLDGDLTENGVVDFNDFAVFGNYWLDETAEGENLNISDIDHDRLTDELDLFYFVDTWLKEE